MFVFNVYLLIVFGHCYPREYHTRPCTSCKLVLAQLAELFMYAGQNAVCAGNYFRFRRNRGCRVVTLTLTLTGLGLALKTYIEQTLKP